MNDKLFNSEVALKAAILLLEKYYKNTESDDIGALLGDINLVRSCETADPAVWKEWEECIKEAQKASS